MTLKWQNNFKDSVKRNLSDNEISSKERYSNSDAEQPGTFWLAGRRATTELSTLRDKGQFRSINVLFLTLNRETGRK